MVCKREGEEVEYIDSVCMEENSRADAVYITDSRGDSRQEGYSTALSLSLSLFLSSCLEQPCN